MSWCTWSEATGWRRPKDVRRRSMTSCSRRGSWTRRCARPSATSRQSLTTCAPSRYSVAHPRVPAPLRAVTVQRRPRPRPLLPPAFHSPDFRETMRFNIQFHPLNYHLLNVLFFSNTFCSRPCQVGRVALSFVESLHKFTLLLVFGFFAWHCTLNVQISNGKTEIDHVVEPTQKLVVVFALCCKLASSIVCQVNSGDYVRFSVCFPFFEFGAIFFLIGHLIYSASGCWWFSEQIFGKSKTSAAAKLEQTCDAWFFRETCFFKRMPVKQLCGAKCSLWNKSSFAPTVCFCV